MTSKSTKRALLTSMMSILLCFTMLLGTTFAWFTDSVTSANNIITAGNLDVELYYQNDEVTTWEKVGSNTNVFKEETLWEPGHVEVVKLKVVNEGSLALKYQLGVNVASETGSVNVAGEPFKLSDYIKFGIVDGEFAGDREAAVAAAETAGTTALNVAYDSGVINLPAKTAGINDNEKIVTVVVYMPTTVGNEANYGKDEAVPTINLGINVYATQLNSEEDSFGPDYDKPAELPDVTVYNATDLADAIAEGGNITLATDVFVDTKLVVGSGKEVVLDLGGNELSGAFTQQGVSALIENKGTLTIKNGSVTSLATNPDTDWNPEGFPTYASNTISNRGVLVVENGAVIENETNVGGASYAIDNYAGANLTINGGEIKAQDVAVRINTASTTAANNVTINGGKITGKRAIWIHVAGSNSAQAPEVNLTINDGDFNSTSDLTIYSYSYGQSFANVNVVFNGGDFEKDVAFGGGYKGDKENVIVNGGVFHGKIGRYIENDAWEDIAKP